MFYFNNNVRCPAIVMKYYKEYIPLAKWIQCPPRLSYMELRILIESILSVGAAK